MSNSIYAVSAKLADLQIDTLSKYRAGQITLDQWGRFNNLSPDDREARFGAGQQNESPRKKEPEPVPSILELVSTVVVSATTSKFVAKDKFVVNTKRNAPVKISAVWDNFTTWFLSGNGKTEDPITEQTLRYHKLRRSSVDGPIINELGGEEKSETTLTEMFSLMEKQKNGEDGVLLTNGYANIFYIRDQNGVLRAVHVYWHVVGWRVYAHVVTYPDAWYGGARVFSRNSVLKSSDTSVPAQA